MKIAILGWGSLIWDPRNLAYDGAWQSGGPQLPLEFSRISRDGRLTLVIDPTYGEPVITCYTTSTLLSLDEAIKNLREREGTSSQYIGSINLVNGKTCTRQNADLVERIRAWCRASGYDAVIWTDLPSNFTEIQGKPFSVENAVSYLKGLSGEAAQKAREYILKAPQEVDTPLRHKIQETDWLNAEAGD